ncbi:zinc finger protein 771 [Aedes aegypti]|uniref:C2H2-type domain-containing protein n=1 Tax=Aedes aegypti TaxID=7159 RepID=A0A1S4EXM5_AEDAE|nr:zinc finger protein 771 [Aedes aegypti]XP_021711677.1 zinc finger protein 771 [Aedes aegypti]
MSSASCVACRTRGSGMVAIYQHPNGLDQMFTSVTGVEVEHEDHLCIPCYDDLKAAHLFKQKCIQNNILRISRSSHREEVAQSQEVAAIPVEIISSKTESIPGAEISTTIADADILEEHLVIRSDVSEDEPEEEEDTELLEENVIEEGKVILDGMVTAEPAETDSIEEDIKPGPIHEHIQSAEEETIATASEEAHAIRCESCNKAFKKLHLLQRHMKSYHQAAESTDEGGEQYVPGTLATLPTVHNLMCEFCFQEFNVLDEKHEHESAHMTEPKPFKCPHCQRTFKDKVGLRSHIRIHSAVKRYKCQHCEMRFHIRGNLTAHERTHIGAKPYLCPHCGKGFAERGNLKSHIRYHTGERPYPCSECPKHFRTHYSRTVHLRSHSNERPFRCTDCDKGFYSSGKLTIHRRVHTGEKPYKCSSCPAKFADSSGLKRHLKKH